jgi:hypothetical protein
VSGRCFTTTHAAQRAAERYGFTPTREDWRQAFLDITDAATGARNSAVLLRRYFDGIERWTVRLAGRPVIAVYNPLEALIITILAPETTTYRPAQPQKRIYGRTRRERVREEVWE